MPITREFLGWDGPILPAVADFIINRYSDRSSLDIESVVLAVPGARAGRRLVDILADKCAKMSLLLVPPRVVTIGQLPNALVGGDVRIVPGIVSELAWIKALSSSPPEEFREFSTYRPGDRDIAGWQSIARDLSAALADVHGAFVDIAAVASIFPTPAGLDESARWRRIDALYSGYLSLIAGHGQDKYAAQRAAVRDGDFQTRYDLILVAAYDLPLATAEVLRHTPANVIALIDAPEEHAGGFDDAGNLDVDYWAQASIPIPAGTVRVAGTPQEQAFAVVDELNKTNRGYDQIVVGLGNPSMTGVIERTMEMSGLPARPAVSRQFSKLGPATALTALADLLDDDRAENFAALIRHPDILDYFRQTEELGETADALPALLDDYISEHLPNRIRSGMAPERSASAPIRIALEAVSGLVSELSDRVEPLGQWGAAIRDLLGNLYRHRRFNRFDRTDDAAVEFLEALTRVLEKLRETASEGPLALETTASGALRFAMQQVSDLMIGGDDGESRVELLGWLELLCDDAPVLLLTGMNEDFVPTSVASDGLLPESVRTALGIAGNQRRYARDAYALQAMLASKESLKIICGRLDSDGNPLRPSRLLFAGAESATVEHALAFYGDGKNAGDLPVLLPHGNRDELADLPLPDLSRPPLSKISVTAFRDYLACPYRFYLKHVLKLLPVDGELLEMDARHVGTLTHRILNDFAASDHKDSQDPRLIDQFLQERLNAHVVSIFGADPSPMLQIQSRQLSRRLTAFSRFQAESSAGGWRIVAHEQAANMQIHVSGGSILVEGRIDRVDRHRETGQHRILDYKISDARPDPEKRHRKRKNQWIDLQLPLYRRMAASVGVTGATEVGFVGRGQQENDITLMLAAWTEDDFASAYACADQVAQAIHDQVFWPPSANPPPFADGFEAICRDRNPERARTIEALSRALAGAGGSQ
ncbi:MAG: PD-(D/E)XK nuclease family protein [Capsulimonadaceae bacterium]|nr:PD-(D/E)XK nuclease family protein [Capsulimonadaceae bacterium]